MDSKDEPNADGAAAENSDTMALNKKRARRVSFAEMTSVHFFDRDDEEYNETPLMETEKINDVWAGESGSDGQSERNKELGGEGDGDGNDDDEEEVEMRRSFLHPIGSPSPGGSTFGSASSNDEYNFFGPVSANFIRPGRLSDSAASDDNHDVTMDSTAFSLHYRSLARSESGVDLKTPTGGQLFFEEKTPVNSNIGSSMVFTLGKKPIQKPTMPIAEVSGSHNSNDMSLVGVIPNQYDYEKLSPGLDALLAESQKNLLYASVPDDITRVSPERKAGKVLSSLDHSDKLVNFSGFVSEETGWINSNSKLNGDESSDQNESGEANDPHGIFRSNPSPNRFSTGMLGVAVDRDNHKPNSSPYQLGKNEFETSLVASTSSPVKQQVLLITASPSKLCGVASPFPEQPASFLINESIEHQETETSIQRSISKLKLLEKHALSSTFRGRIDSSTVSSLDFLKSPNFDNLFERSHQISRINFAKGSLTEEKTASVHQSTERNFAFSTDHARGEDHLEEPAGQIMNGKSPNELNAKHILADQSKYGGTASLPSKGNNLTCSLSASKHNNEGSAMTETETFFAEIASGEDGKPVTPKFVSSPGRMLEKKLPAPPGSWSSQSDDFLLRSQFKQVSDFEKGRDSTPERKLSHVNLSSATAIMDTLSKGIKGQLSFAEVNCLNLIELRATDNSTIDVHNGQDVIGTIGNFRTPSKGNKSQIVRSENLDVGNLTSRDSSSFKDNVPGAEFRMDFHDSVSPSADRNLENPRLQESLVQFSGSRPSRKGSDNKLPSRMPSPKTIQLSGGLSANKQRRTEINIMERSPKLQKVGNYDTETIIYPVEGRTGLIGPEEKKWTDTYSKFTEDMKKLIFGSADKLNTKMIDVLEDMLVHQQRLKVYEMLHHGVMPQNSIFHRDLQLEKIAEANSLLHRVVFERAKLQLKHVKRERLLKRLELFSYRMQESQMLGANIASVSLETCTSNIQDDAVGDLSVSVNLRKEPEVRHEKLTAMRQTLEALDKKIWGLTRTFNAYYKMKAEPGCPDTIALVNEQLIKRAACRFIHLDMQMWVVHSVCRVNGQHNIFLNYLDFIMQSTKIIVGPTSSARTSVKLNETTITKNFPNMDACIAFEFVFNAETVRKYIGVRTLAQETQVTSSLLGILLDVIGEVQLAQMEFQNLTQSSFCSPSVDRLDLMLCFLSFNSGRKVVLTLDMSCLKCGIYPSEILPLQLASPVDSKKGPPSGPIFDEIRNAVKGVRSGYMRILRICRCVSQVVQASTA